MGTVRTDNGQLQLQFDSEHILEVNGLETVSTALLCQSGQYALQLYHGTV